MSTLYDQALEETKALLQELRRSGQKSVTLSTDVAEALRRLSLLEPASAPTHIVTSTPPPAEVAAVTNAPSTASPALRPALIGSPEKIAALQALGAEVCACARCELHGTRTQTVFGVGNPDAELVFVGEAPGADEDRLGEPFVGKAGGLLNDIITKGMQMRREEVYICNVLKCRPPGNRTPSPEEMIKCEQFLLKQLEIIQPKVICALGKVSAQCLLRSDDPVGRLRGKWYDYHGIPLMVTFHPAYLLRNPTDKKLAWQDIRAVIQKLAELK